MILYMTWFSERGRELAARIIELSLSVSYGLWQSRYGGHPAVSKIQIRERGNRSLPDFLEEAFAQQFPVIFIGALGIAVRAIAPLIRHKTVDSPVLVLDEATSSIDTETEIILQKGLNELLKGRTSFIIAHRLSTIKNSSCIMYVDKGTILEKGTHDELMAQKGEYYKLYMSQYASLM